MKRTFYYSLLLMGLMACNGTGQNGGESGQNGLRSDGYYKCEMDKIIYLMRFSPKGNVVLTAGHQDNYADMIGLLDPEAPDQNNVYNVEYTLLPNDSIFFYTTSPKGKINYRGSVIHSDTLRVLKKSLINGKEATLDYVFEAFREASK